MTTPTKFNILAADCLRGIHDFENDTFKAMLTNVAPAAGDEVKADITDIPAGNGYSAGGVVIPAAVTQHTATGRVTFTDASITAAGGSIGPFRYVVIYNDTAAGKPLVCFAQVPGGASITVLDGDPYNIRFAAGGTINFG